MPVYTYVKASQDDVIKLLEPTYFPTGLPPRVEEVLNPKAKLYVDRSRGLFSYSAIEGFEEFIEILSNYIVGVAIDPVEAVVKLDLVTVYNDHGYLLEKGKRVVIIEARGKGGYPLINEGSEVAKGDRVFYIVTGKHEVRVVRSPIDGVLLVISELIPSEIQVFRAVLVNRDELVMLKRVR